MNYTETLEYLYGKLPMFTKVGASAFKKDLHNTIAMCKNLGNPQNKFKSIHVGGTNGKGSTSHMIAAILQQAGYKTGLYTSPHLKDFRERIRINGQMASEQFVIDFVEEQKELIESISPSFFEVTVAMAFGYFAKEKVDIAVIEVGLGGRLDSTNVINPELAVITNISLDHTNLLGNTLEEIATEKAGIIKPGIPVIIGESQSETDNVFIEKAGITKSNLTFADQVLKVTHTQTDSDYLEISVQENNTTNTQKFQLDLTGLYQAKNLITVLKAISALQQQGYEISEDAITTGLKNVKQLTGLQGRWQQLGVAPLIICDTGHNIAGIKEVILNIERIKYDHLHMVIGMVKDKDISGVLRILPKHATYYFCRPDLERAMDASQLAEMAAEYQLKGEIFNDVETAILAAKKSAGEKDMIFIGGSTFVVAEAL